MMQSVASLNALVISYHILSIIQDWAPHSPLTIEAGALVALGYLSTLFVSNRIYLEMLS